MGSGQGTQKNNEENQSMQQRPQQQKIRIQSQEKFELSEIQQNNNISENQSFNNDSQNYSQQFKKKSIYQPNPPYNYGDLSERLQRLSLPKCTKGQNHKLMEFVCTEENCDQEDRLKILCRKCIQKVTKEGVQHKTQPLLEVFDSLIGQLQMNKSIQKKLDDSTNFSSSKNINIPVDQQYKNLSKILQKSIDQLKKLQNNLQKSYDNHLKSLVNNQKIQDSKQIRKILENITKDSSELKLDYFFKKLKNFLTIQKGQAVIVNYSELIEEQIDRSSKSYCQEVQKNIEQVQQLLKQSLDEAIPVVYDDIENLREIEKQKFLKKQQKEHPRSQSQTQQKRRSAKSLQKSQNQQVNQQNKQINEPQFQSFQQRENEIDEVLNGSQINNREPPNFQQSNYHSSDKHNKTQTNSDLFSDYRPSSTMQRKVQHYQPSYVPQTPPSVCFQASFFILLIVQQQHQLNSTHFQSPSDISRRYQQQQNMLRSRNLENSHRDYQSQSEKKYTSTFNYNNMMVDKKYDQFQQNLPVILNQSGNNSAISARNEQIKIQQALTAKQQKMEEEQRQRQMELEKQQKIKQEQKQKLINQRFQLVTEMENHVRGCNHQLCRKIEWGMETEYKFIGWKDENMLNTEGRKKTSCQQGKELNAKMKEVVRKLRLIQG